MQWDASEYAGFSAARPWLPLAKDHAKENVALLDADPHSILSLYRALIALRRKLPALSKGDYRPVKAEGDLLVYRRDHEGHAVTIALNLGAAPASVAINDGMILLSTLMDRQGDKISGVLRLRGNEGIVVG
jgi:alpha-glucosidase